MKLKRYVFVKEALESLFKQNGEVAFVSSIPKDAELVDMFVKKSNTLEMIFRHDSFEDVGKIMDYINGPVPEGEPVKIVVTPMRVKRKNG